MICDLTYFRKVGQKYRNILVRFLVQMKKSKSHSEINRPLQVECSQHDRIVPDIGKHNIDNKKLQFST